MLAVSFRFNRQIELVNAWLLASCCGRNYCLPIRHGGSRLPELVLAIPGGSSSFGGSADRRAR